MKRTPLKRIGKIGNANMQANKLIREILEGKQIGYCELRLAGCLGDFPLQIAHRHQRAWYKGNVELLAHPKQWVVACQHCHEQIDKRTPEAWELTEDMFSKLRP